MKDTILDSEYSEEFDNLRKNRVAISYYKYGPARMNFKRGYVRALGSLKKCIKKYEETHNTEYLCDAANYAMFEFMFPMYEDAYFKATDSNESAGIEGISINEMEQLKLEDI